MRIVLDTSEKVIKVEESVNLGELIETLDKILPLGEWKAFKLDTNSVIQWNTPILLKEYIRTSPLYPYPTYPWYQPLVTPTVTYQSGMEGVPTLHTGHYCIEA